MSLRQFTGQFDIFSTLYSTKDAEKKTEFTVDTETINLAVPLFGSSLGLVTTPSKPQVIFLFVTMDVPICWRR